MLTTLSHSKLIKYMHALGYELHEKGFCLGIAGVGVQAILSDDVDTFNNRLKAIEKIPIDKFEQQITKLNKRRITIIAEEKKKLEKQMAKELQIKIDKKSPNPISFLSLLDQAQEKIFYERLNNAIAKKLKKFKANELLLLDVITFFEGVELHFNIQNHPELFTEQGKPLDQNLEKSFSVLQADNSENRIVKADSFSGIYKLDELTLYFQTLRKSLEGEKACNYPITLQLGSGNHAITVGYDPKQKAWTFIDANSLPAQKGIIAEKEIAQKVLKAFSKNEYATFTTTVYVKKENGESCKAYMKDWRKQENYQKIHKIVGKEKAYDSYGSTWLSLAAREGDIETVKKLLKEIETKDFSEKKDNKEKFDNDYSLGAGYENNLVYKAALISAQFGQVEILKILLNSLDKYGVKREDPLLNFNILNLAAAAGKIDVFEKIYPPLNINAQIENSSSVLQIAFNSKHNTIVEKLLNDPLLSPTRENLDIALDRNNFDAVVRMLKHNFDNKLLTQVELNKVNEYGEGVLFHAVYNKEYSLIKKLCPPNGPLDIKVKTRRNLTLLHVAATNVSNEKDVYILADLSREIDINAKGLGGNTPLSLAIQSGNEYAARKLLELGADPSIANDSLENPLSIAIQKNQLYVLKLLLQHDKLDPNTTGSYKSPLGLAFENNNLAAMELLLNHKSTIIDYSYFDYKKNNKGQDVLYFMALHGKLDLIQKLIPPNGKLDVNKMTPNKATLLHAAAEGGHLELIKKLAAPNGPLDLNAKTMDGDTILHIAIKNGKIDTVKGLLELGLDVNIKNNQGLYKLAIEYNQPNIQQLLSSQLEKNVASTTQIHKIFGSKPIIVADENDVKSQALLNHNVNNETKEKEIVKEEDFNHSPTKFKPTGEY